MDDASKWSCSIVLPSSFGLDITRLTLMFLQRRFVLRAMFCGKLWQVPMYSVGLYWYDLICNVMIVYLYIYTYIYIYIYIYMHIYICIHIYLHNYTHTFRCSQWFRHSLIMSSLHFEVCLDWFGFLYIKCRCCPRLDHLDLTNHPDLTNHSHFLLL